MYKAIFVKDNNSLFKIVTNDVELKRFAFNANPYNIVDLTKEEFDSANFLETTLGYENGNLTKTPIVSDYSTVEKFTNKIDALKADFQIIIDDAERGEKIPAEVLEICQAQLNILNAVDLNNPPATGVTVYRHLHNLGIPVLGVWEFSNLFYVN